MTTAQSFQNRAYQQPAEHSFPVHLLQGRSHDDLTPAAITLSNMTGMPLPWPMLENGLRFMLHEAGLWDLHNAVSHEDITLIDPDSGAENETVLSLTYRQDPSGPTYGKDGVRRFRGTLEAKPAIPAPLSFNVDPLAMPITRIWTETAVDTGKPPVPVEVIASAGARRHTSEVFCRRMGDAYALTEPQDRSDRELALGVANLDWDLANAMLASDADISHCVGMLNLRNAARRILTASGKPLAA